MTSGSLFDQLHTELDAWKAKGLERSLTAPAGIDFTSNNYLGLSTDPRVIRAAREAMNLWGAGLPAARLLRGHNSLYSKAEASAADWLGTEAALLFPTGWQANLAVLTSFLKSQDVAFSDSLNHASLIDGLRLSKAQRTIFNHNDMDDLKRQLADHSGARRRIIVVEDVYSMDGDRAPIETLLKICEQFDAYLYVDHAHSIGLYEVHREAHPRFLARMFTGGKALGLCAAFVCASKTVIDLLINKGRSFVFTTALPPPTVAALHEAMTIARNERALAKRAFRNAKQLRDRLHSAGIPTLGESPIVPIVLGETQRSLEVAQRARDAGFDIRAIRPPTVPKGQSRLRIVCHGTHSLEIVNQLADVLISAINGTQQGEQDTISDHAGPKGFIVCGTDTDVGKTIGSAALLRSTRLLCPNVRYLKPMQTGSDSDTETVVELADVDRSRVLSPVLELPLPASVDQAALHSNVEVRMNDIVEKTKATLNKHPDDFWILETAGGIRVPMNPREDQADLIGALRLPVVLIARSSLGTLNHTLLTAEALQSRRIPLKALILIGPEHKANKRTLSEWLPNCPIMEMPHFEHLSPESIDQWIRTQDWEWLKCLTH
ncbi:MAG: dethiobiotin synthase [Planctomycetota bacterium]|nr:dethiobiotin synthase [Planctomycetota bacterium]